MPHKEPVSLREGIFSHAYGNLQSFNNFILRLEKTFDEGVYLRDFSLGGNFNLEEIALVKLEHTGNDVRWEHLNLVVEEQDLVIVQTASGPIQIQPQRTNNILEQFFRKLKRSNRRKTGNKSSSRMLRTMLAETPLVNNLYNSEYMKILLKEKTSLEEVFAEIEIDTLREEFRKAQLSPEKVPIKINRLIAMPDYPERLVKMVEKAVALS